MHNWYKNSALIVILFMSAVVKAQVAPSPFSSLGIGQHVSPALVQNMGSGGLGIGTGSYWNLNNVNPALLVYNRGTIFSDLTIFQTGIAMESGKISNGTASDKTSGANMNYLTTGFPILKKKWNAAIGIMPYSVLNYNLNYTYDIIGPTDSIAYIQENGKGGVNRIFWSNGFALNKNFSVGIKGNYLFSSTTYEISNVINDSDFGIYNVPTIYERTSHSGFLFNSGIVYQDTIRNVENKDPITLTVGVQFDHGGKIKAKNFKSFQKRNLSNTSVNADTLVDNVEGKLEFPQSIGFGFSIGQPAKWSLGVDYKQGKWSEFKSFGNSVNFANTTSYTIGGEFTPDAFSVDKYLKRVTFRVGGSYETTPYVINGMQVKDFGINFGMTFPVQGLSSLDFAIRAGKMGNVAENLIEQNYIKAYLGFTFNDRWFVRRKFN